MIYTIRRFSETQKEFGWIRDRLQKTVDEEKSLKEKYEKRFKSSDRLIDFGLENKIIEANKSIAEVSPKEFDRLTGSSYMKDSTQSLKELKKFIKDNREEEFTEDMKILIDELMEKYQDKKISDIYWDRRDGVDQLVHELGHVKNYRGNLLDRFIRKGAKFGAKFEKASPGAVNAFLSIIKGKFIDWEEKNASNKAYELLKKYNLPPQDFQMVKDNLDNALKHYQSKHKISWRQRLIDSKIPKWLL